MKKSTNFIFILLVLFSCRTGNGERSMEKKCVYILKKDVMLYKKKDSSELIPFRKFNLFEEIKLLSVDSNWIKVETDRKEIGWVEEKYTSYLSNDWEKNFVKENVIFYSLRKYPLQVVKRIFEGKESYAYILPKNQFLLTIYEKSSDLDSYLSEERDKFKKSHYNGNWIHKFQFKGREALFSYSEDTGDSITKDVGLIIKLSPKKLICISSIIFEDPKFKTRYEDDRLMRLKTMFSVEVK